MTTHATKTKPASIERLVESIDLGIESLHPGGLLMTREMAELAGVNEDTYVLDVAAGTGESACFIAETFGCQVQGLDLSPEMVARATRKAKKRGLNAQFSEGDARSSCTELPTVPLQPPS